MILKSRYIVFIFVLAFTSFAKAQQIPHYSQFWFNDFVSNPAFAGTKPYYQVKSNNRYQWIGVNDAPRTFILSGFGPEKSKDMGYGAQIFSDVVGPTSRLGFYGSYAYNIRLKDDIRLSMGLSVGIMQFKIDGSQITLHDSGDPSLGTLMYSTNAPDADFGLLIYTEQWNFGIVAKQLVNYNVDYKDLESLQKNVLKTHFQMHGDYRFDINNDWSVEPFAILKFLYPAPLQVDFGFRGIWKKMIWLGTSWRSQDAVSIMLGYEYDNQISFGYSYDITTSNLRTASSGSHEIMIGFKFSNIKKKSANTKL